MGLVYVKYSVDGKLYCNILSSIETYKSEHTLIRFLDSTSDLIEFNNLLIKNTRNAEREVLIDSLLNKNLIDLTRIFPHHEILFHYDSEQEEAYRNNTDYLGISL